MKLRFLLTILFMITLLTTISKAQNPMLQTPTQECNYQCQLQKLCTGDNSKNFKNINSSSCLKFQEYYFDLVEASRKYSTPTLKLTPYVLAGLIDRETLWTKALKPATCEGYGDGDYGHGLVQIHGLFSTPKLNKFAKPNTSVLKSTKKYGNLYFNWSSCKESIYYLGAYLMNVEDSYGFDQKRLASRSSQPSQKVRNASTVVRGILS